MPVAFSTGRVDKCVVQLWLCFVRCSKTSFSSTADCSGLKQENDLGIAKHRKALDLVASTCVNRGAMLRICPAAAHILSELIGQCALFLVR